MIVEFIGTSGAGKSTLIRATFSELASRGSDVHRWNADGGRDVTRWKRNHNVSAVLEAFQNVRLGSWCFRHAKSQGSLSFVQNARQLRWMLGAARSSRKLRHIPGIHLLDEGPTKVATPMRLAGSVGSRDFWMPCRRSTWWSHSRSRMMSQ